MFFDRARIYVKGGDGGNGIVAFRRERHVAKGGPSGGNGGRGGHVVASVNPGMNTLQHLRRRAHYRAQRGGRGGNTEKRGAEGDDLIVGVPPGTLIRDADTGELLADLVQDGQSACVARGGRGGKGNAAFRNSRHQAPRLAENGEPGEERWVELELKLVAEVGIIGVPNAGKSTLISRISAARPEIADYPFTTTVPNLGVVELEHRQRVFVDIPGLIEGAHEGTGLGIEFLRHVERTRLLVHLLDGSAADPLAEQQAIETELQLYSEALMRKPRLLVLNKMDLPTARDHAAALTRHYRELNVPFFTISAVTGENLQALVYEVDRQLQALPPEPEPEALDMPEIAPAVESRAFQVRSLEAGVWRVESAELERVVRMTNWDYFDSAMRFQHILDSWGVKDELQRQGIEEGDTVVIAGHELIWGYDNAF